MMGSEEMEDADLPSGSTVCEGQNLFKLLGPPSYRVGYLQHPFADGQAERAIAFNWWNVNPAAGPDSRVRSRDCRRPQN